VLCIGRGGDGMAASISDPDPRIHATGELDAAGLSRAIQACDVFVQPYPDGATTRRTSLTTLLAHGAAVVTTTGTYTEPLWMADGDVVAVAPAGDRRRLAAEVTRLVESGPRRAELGASARAFYLRRLEPAHSVDALLRGGASPHVVNGLKNGRIGA
jgi:glycosyltransferase involved in cell wall biosynthesis